MNNETETSILDALPLEKVEAYYEAPKKHYWLQDDHGVWIQVCGGDVLKRLDAKGYSAKAPKGRRYSPADDELEAIRMKNAIKFAGAVAGNMPGIKGPVGNRYLVTSGPNLITPVKGEWENIKKVADRLFGGKQLEYVLGWSQNAVKALYTGSYRRGQLLALAGPGGIGKSFWQMRIITPMLGGRHGKPMQFMSGQTAFNADIIGSEHLMLDDEIAKTDRVSRESFSNAIKQFTASPTQRIHGKGDNGFSVESSHWISLSVNNEPEKLAVLPPLEPNIVDKIMLLRCYPSVNEEWPGDKKAVEKLNDLVDEEMAAFIYYLLNEHVVRDEISNTRYGVEAYHDEELVTLINGMSAEAELEFLIDRCWEEHVQKKLVLRIGSREMRQTLIEHPKLGRQAEKVVSFRDRCGQLLKTLAERKPSKFTAPSPHAEPRLWKIDWRDDNAE